MTTEYSTTNLPVNYIYISHLGEHGTYFELPCWPDSIQDSMKSTFSEQNALSRSAPVFTYSYSGPRTIQVTLELHRDMVDELNVGFSNAVLEPNEDYTDTLIKALQAIALPRYNLDNKVVEPPMVAIRFGNEIFIKGIVSGGVTVTYKKPIITNDRYVNITVAFTVSEVDPYDAQAVFQNGGFRGLTRTLQEGLIEQYGRTN